MKIVISSEISCDEKGYPIYHEEHSDCFDIWPSDMTIIRIYSVDNVMYMDLKEDFNLEYIEADEGGTCSIKKSSHVPSKRVGKYALYRCSNCSKADECKNLVGESTLIKHF